MIGTISLNTIPTTRNYLRVYSVRKYSSKRTASGNTLLVRSEAEQSRAVRDCIGSDKGVVTHRNTEIGDGVKNKTPSLCSSNL